MSKSTPREFASQTSGSGFAPDAMPFKDIPEGPRAAAFELRNGEVLLRGSKSRSSGSKAFPERQVCMETGARDMEPMLFGPTGTLYSFSTVHVSSSRPTPYTIGYVDFPDDIRVLANLDPALDPTTLRCGMAVEVRADNDHWFVVPTKTLSGVKS